MTDIDLTQLRLLDINDLIDLLKISRSSVYRLVDSGALKSVRIGRFRRVRFEDLAAFVDAQAVTAVTDPLPRKERPTCRS